MYYRNPIKTCEARSLAGPTGLWDTGYNLMIWIASVQSCICDRIT